MGEVYRAEDLKLGQPVALKFLPEGFERDPQRLSRFLNEVKIARQVSHSNVCRAFDVGEVDGQHFISMEYVDGEDLASLLRRIGWLPKDKAIQVARQICAGVAAAHEQGILHRDLKPANVMVDGRGRVKITDFGLAGLAASFGESEIASGTPAYMAPEQLAGREVTTRSDIYALGLVLYELFTGKRAFEATTPAELARLQSESKPTNPSSHVEGFDPSVEKVILRCLEREPKERPASALAVAAALPGSDPLAAALAAGETPLPEMVADAGSREGLRPAVAVACLALILLGLAVHPFLAEKTSMTRAVGLELPPAALAVEARKILEEAGHTAPARDTAQGFYIDYEYSVHERGQAPEKRWKEVGVARPAPIIYWYRQSPRYLTPTSFSNGGIFRLSHSNPPFDVSGMANVSLDPRGRLRELYVLPPQVDDSEGPGPEPDWSLLFDRAGIDMTDFEPAQPKWSPLFDCDLRRAWEGAYADRPDVPIRIEAGAWRGRPVYFAVRPPWSFPWRMESIVAADESRRGQKAASIVGFGLLLVTLAGGLMLARRNLRLGRGDRQSAFRVALIVLLSTMGSWVLGGHHEPTFAEVGLFFQALFQASFAGGVAYTVYIAIEPHVRRLWPNLMIAWNRLFQGRFRDPLIGRDILIGAVAATAAVVLVDFGNLLPEWLGLPLADRGFEDVESLSGMRQVLARCASLPMALTLPILTLLLLLLLRTILRRQWAAVSVLILLWGTAELASVNSVISGSIVVIGLGLSLFVLLRHGLLASMAMALFEWRFGVWTTDLSSWYAGQMMILPLLLAAIAVYAFYISLAGRPLFSAKLFDEDGAKV